MADHQTRFSDADVAHMLRRMADAILSQAVAVKSCRVGTDLTHDETLQSVAVVMIGQPGSAVELL